MAGRMSMDDRRFRPPAQTSVHPRPTTAPHSGTQPPKRKSTLGKDGDSPPAEAREPNTKSGHQRFVLNDPVAFRYLEEDPSTTVLERRRELQGYECYIVEQWTTSRTHPTFVITTYTGDPIHNIMVGVLSVPTDESKWSPRLRVYFKALNQYHARRRETPLGTLMVTNLTAFPSSLTVIPVPGGDLKKHRFEFLVNEDLKRLGCSGRVGMTLAPPSAATIAKYHQLYRTSDKIEIYKSVVELVKLCQSALMLFNKLDIDYADGLLCDVTEGAINDWWVEIGSEYHSVEPHDGILGPTTVAALLGLLMGARNRLHAVSAPVGKDAFDVDAMKRGIGTFQKQQRITRSRRLDRQTLDRLHRLSAKAASSESWTVPRVVKSTVAELSGKGGEMVMDSLGRRDRAGIADIETTDLERFTQLIYGERCKWLWYGKALKKTKEPEEVRLGVPGLVFKPDEQGGFTWTGRKSTADGVPVPDRERFNDLATPASQDEDDTDDETQKRGLLHRAATFKNTGLGKFKGVVGIKAGNKMPQDDVPRSPVDDSASDRRRPLLTRSLSSPISGHGSPTSTAEMNPMDEITASPAPRKGTREYENWPGLQPETTIEQPNASRESLQAASTVSSEQAEDMQHAGSDRDSTAQLRRFSIADADYPAVRLDEALPTGQDTEQDVGTLLHRTLSYSHFVSVSLEAQPKDNYPRHLSFTLAEDSVLTWNTLTQDPESDEDDLAAEYAAHELRAQKATNLRLAINKIMSSTGDWTGSQLSHLQELLPLGDQNADSLKEMYQPRLESLQSLQTNIESMLREEREMLEEGGKELETLVSKLDYEIDGLRGRVEDVESGVNDFENAVGRVEDRVTELEKEGRGGTSWNCVVQ